jgi:hypothetical protein
LKRNEIEIAKKEQEPVGKIWNGVEQKKKLWKWNLCAEFRIILKNAIIKCNKAEGKCENMKV